MHAQFVFFQPIKTFSDRMLRKLAGGFVRHTYHALKNNAFLMTSTAATVYIVMEEICSIGVVVGRSMLPTFNAMDPMTGEIGHDIVLVNKWSVKSAKKGDIVIFRAPTDPTTYNIKRIIAEEGEIVNNKEIPVGHVWVEGDNKMHSVDSNSYGPLPKGLIKGKIDYILYPKLRKIQKIDG
jgi:inner membrane protease subunit 2